MPPLEIETNVARLMVRRHLGNWLKRLPEDKLIDLTVDAMQKLPDKSMAEVMKTVDRALRLAVLRARARHEGPQ